MLELIDLTELESLQYIGDDVSVDSPHDFHYCVTSYNNERQPLPDGLSRPK
jgi:hypothetical protein